jgi:hypothetical protein
MKKMIRSVGLVFGLAAIMVSAAEKDTHCYEMRTYYAAPGKLEDLNARFRNHTVKLFEKHGIVNIGYWMPMENPDNKLIYILSYPSREARDKSWKAFAADPDWQAAHKASEKNGPLVAKVDQLYLTATDYSPAIKPGASNKSRAFELRTYAAAPGKLENLNARFRDHTAKLFEKHGMTNIGYWNPMSDQPGSDNTLIYILAHESKEAAGKSFKAFGSDAEWMAARKESEKNGPLTVQGGVKSVFMTPTDYSPMK